MEKRVSTLEKTVAEHSVKIEYQQTFSEELKIALKELVLNVQKNNNLLEKRNAVDTFIWKMLGGIVAATGLLITLYQLFQQ